MLSSLFSGLSIRPAARFTCGQRLQDASSLYPGRIGQPMLIEAAHKKGGGSTKNGRDSNSKRRGVKVYGGQPVKAGGIIVRQVGCTFHAGSSVALGKDYTLYSLIDGIVVFNKNKYISKVSVVPEEEYVVPEGQQVKEGSRKMRRRELYTPRAVQRAEMMEVAGQLLANASAVA
eukprot:jgi/Botrbrau1/10651/Bobra.53_2s0009.1